MQTGKRALHFACDLRTKRFAHDRCAGGERKACGAFSGLMAWKHKSWHSWYIATTCLFDEHHLTWSEHAYMWLVRRQAFQERTKFSTAEDSERNENNLIVKHHHTARAVSASCLFEKIPRYLLTYTDGMLQHIESVTYEMWVYILSKAACQ